LNFYKSLFCKLQLRLTYIFCSSKAALICYDSRQHCVLLVLVATDRVMMTARKREGEHEEV
jgi:hypothetical protein